MQQHTNPLDKIFIINIQEYINNKKTQYKSFKNKELKT